MDSQVEQIDRQAAAKLLGGAAPVGLLAGAQDSLSLVQAFTAHRLASLALPKVESETWQPIETAPKDGTVVDLWIAGDFGEHGERRADAYWGRPSHICGEAGSYCDCCPSYDGWVDSTFNHYLNGDDGLGEEPTHWRPLPTPPSTLNTGGTHE